MEPAGFDKDKPVPLDWDYDAMRKAVFDLDTGWNALVREVQEDCAIMWGRPADVYDYIYTYYILHVIVEHYTNKYYWWLYVIYA